MAKKKGYWEPVIEAFEKEWGDPNEPGGIIRKEVIWGKPLRIRYYTNVPKDPVLYPALPPGELRVLEAEQNTESIPTSELGEYRGCRFVHSIPTSELNVSSNASRASRTKILKRAGTC